MGQLDGYMTVKNDQYLVNDSETAVNQGSWLMIRIVVIIPDHRCSGLKLAIAGKHDDKIVNIGD